MNHRSYFDIDWNLPTIMNISGGRTSGYLANILKDKPVEFIFQNTGREREETYEFLNKMTKEWNIKITWLEYTKEKPFFKIVDFETANRTGKPFEEIMEKRRAVPNKFKRFCTQELKVKTCRRYMRSRKIKAWNTLIGFRYDEPNRVRALMKRQVGKIIKEYCYAPLYDMVKTIQNVEDFWKNNSFDLNLPLLPNGKTFGGNCKGCFWHSEYQNAMLCKTHPKDVEWLIKQEEKYGYTFMDGISWKEFRKLVEQTPQRAFELEDFYCPNVLGTCMI